MLLVLDGVFFQSEKGSICSFEVTASMSRKNKNLSLQRLNSSRRSCHRAQCPLLHPRLWQLQTTECLQHQKEHTGRAKKPRAPWPCISCPISAPSPGMNCVGGDSVAKVVSESGQEQWRSLNWVPGTSQGLAKPF